MPVKRKAGKPGTPAANTEDTSTHEKTSATDLAKINLYDAAALKSCLDETTRQVPTEGGKQATPAILVQD